MRARTPVLAMGLLALAPLVALAAEVPLDIPIQLPPAFYGPGPYQTALKTGDTLNISAFVLNPSFSVTADLSALGLPVVSSSVSDGPFFARIQGVTYPSVYIYPLGTFTVPVLSNGQKTVTVSGADSAGDTGAASTTVTLDSTPPTVTLTNLHFSTTSPRDGDTMYFSGHASGTGTKAGVYTLTETLLDAASVPITRDGVHPARVSYDFTPLQNALAASPDGSFTDVPITLWEAAGDVPLAPASYLLLEVGVYDEAGNATSSTITAPINTRATTTSPGVSNVLFIPGTEASRLYMKNGLLERELWEPSTSSDIPELAMNQDGTSFNTVYTKDIIGNLYDNTALGGTIDSELGDTAKVYGDFERYMDSLVASTTVGMSEWHAYPYDWRYDPIDVVKGGTLTKMSDGTLQQVYLENILDQMASTSRTGKVTIVAHSNGGLVAKALMQKLMAEGKASEVDQLVFVGTPQWGTPVDIGAMLHGDGGSLGLGFVAYAPEVRAAAAGMPDIYALLPSAAYFAHVAGPVASFKDSGMAKPFYDRFPSGIHSWSELSAFAGDTYGLDALVTDPDALDTPYRLSPGLLEKAAATHTTLDSWVPPPGLKVVSLAGWGQLTAASYDYAEHQGHTFCLNIFTGFSCVTKPQFVHVPQVTEDGDGTVVSPSATAAGGDVWYFDAAAFRSDKKGNIVHKDLLGGFPVQNSLTDLLSGTGIADSYMVQTKPPAVTNPLTIIGTESPVNLLVTDSGGHETGIVSLPGVSGLYFKKQDIPGSAVEVSGENKFIILPAAAAYSVVATGYASGPTNLLVESVGADGSITASTAVTNIPVATSTAASFSVSAAGGLSPIAIDSNGDGVADASITPTPGQVTPFKKYRWEGFLQPINDTSHQVGVAQSVFKAGSTVPVKFVLKNDAGVFVQAAIMPEWLTPQRGAPMAAAIDESLYSGSGTTGTVYKWDASVGQYVYNWSTKGLAAGYWYRIYAKLDGGQTYSVTIGLK